MSSGNFRGTNQLLLNESTMKVAVQEYLDRRTIGGADQVNYITYNGGNNGVFKVGLTEKKAVAK